MKKSLFSIAFFLSASILSFSQMPTTTPLKEGDVDKFIKTYEPLVADLDALGESFDNVGDYNMIQTLAANEKIKSVFAKHGWDGDWTGKWITISIAYGLVKMEEEMAKMPAEQRAQVQQYMAASSEQMKAMITEDDLQKVKSKMEELNKIFDK
ncbi:hypothetical protein [Ekhidna sp.]|uniref:hypothetical protein n=1 Tax=Ekhidna sp. TaxID=2608089 RepID=UPI003B50DC2E